MKRACLGLGALVIITTSGGAARADFLVQGAGAAIPNQSTTANSWQPGPGVVADAPHVDPGNRTPPPPAPTRTPARPKPRMVWGFGDQVPLAFACRQILPPSIEVHYGPGADPGMLVTWRGGDTWPRVLAAAIKPLGLHMRHNGLRLVISS